MAWLFWMEIKNIINGYRGLYRQLLSFAIIGTLSNIGGYGVYLLLTYVGTTPIVAMSILYPVGAITGFFANRRFTFRHDGYLGAVMVRYLLCQILGYVLNLSMLLVFVDWFGFPHWYVQAVAIIVVAVFLFIVSKVFVFSA